MDARNTFSVLGLLDGDATVGALRFALRGAHPSALLLPSSPFGAASSARGHPSARVGAASNAAIGHPSARVGAASNAAIGLPAAHVGASSSAAIGLPAAHVGATSSAAIGLPAAHAGATSSAVLGLPTALPGASSSIRGKDVSSEVEHRHFGQTVDPALLLAPADPEEGWTKVKPAAKHRAPRAVAAPHPAPVTPAAAEPEDELREIRGGPGLRGPRMRDITKWILVTEVSRAGLCGRSLRHQI